jgi:hypothetical protein
MHADYTGGAPLSIIKQYIENQARPLRRAGSAGALATAVPCAPLPIAAAANAANAVPSVLPPLSTRTPLEKGDRRVRACLTRHALFPIRPAQ